MSPWKLKTMGMQGSRIVEGDHDGNDEDSLCKQKHQKILQTPSHTSKIVTTNNLETLTSWFCSIQNGMQLKHHD